MSGKPLFQANVIRGPRPPRPGPSMYLGRYSVEHLTLTLRFSPPPECHYFVSPWKNHGLSSDAPRLEFVLHPSLVDDFRSLDCYTNIRSTSQPHV